MIIDGDPMGDYELKEQCARLPYHLTKSRRLSKAKSHNSTSFPHISFGRFCTLDEAYDFRSALVKQDIDLFTQPIQILPPIHKYADIALKKGFNPV